MIRKAVLAAVAVSCALVYFHHRKTERACLPEFSDEFQFHRAKASPARARIYLFGSLNILSADFDTRAEDEGFEVINLQIPQIQPCLYVHDGSDYREALRRALRSVVMKVEASNGHLPSIIGGGSIGGLHAIMGFAIYPKFDAWFASMTVTELSSLSEFNGSQPGDFDPFEERLRLAGSTGFISWGTADSRVDFRKTRELYAAIHSPSILSIEYAGMEHSTTPKQIDDLLSWLNHLTGVVAQHG